MKQAEIFWDNVGKNTTFKTKEAYLEHVKQKHAKYILLTPAERIEENEVIRIQLQEKLNTIIKIQEKAIAKKTDNK